MGRAEDRVTEGSGADSFADLFLPGGIVQRQTSLLRAIFATLSDGIAVADEAGRLIFCNQAGDEILCTRTLDIPQNRWSQTFGFMLPDKVTPYPNDELPLSRALRGEIVSEVTVYVNNPRMKSPAYLSVTAYPLHEVPNQICGAVAVFRDVTKEKHRSEDLIVAQETFRKVFEDGAFGLAITDCNLRYLKVNRALTEISGYSEAELMNRTVLEIAHPEDEAIILKMREELLKKRRDKAIFEKRYTHRDGSIVWARVTVNPVFSPSQEFLFFVTMIEDITTGKDAEITLQQRATELARSNAELEQFAYAASHDLKEPLRMVSTFANLLKQRYHDKLDTEANEYINYAMQAVYRMNSLIDALLEYSRVSKNVENREWVNIRGAVDHAVENLKVAWREAGAELTCSELPTLWGNEGILVRLFQNLLSNALKFRRPERLHITISAKDEGDNWVFAVGDDGIGIEAKYFDRIFLLFQRLHTRDEYPGSGVGLSICKKIVESMGGTIWVESMPGMGSTFFFRLPGKPHSK